MTQNMRKSQTHLGYAYIDTLFPTVSFESFQEESASGKSPKVVQLREFIRFEFHTPLKDNSLASERVNQGNKMCLNVF